MRKCIFLGLFIFCTELCNVHIAHDFKRLNGVFLAYFHDGGSKCKKRDICQESHLYDKCIKVDFQEKFLYSSVQKG